MNTHIDSFHLQVAIAPSQSPSQRWTDIPTESAVLSSSSWRSSSSKSANLTWFVPGDFLILFSIPDHVSWLCAREDATFRCLLRTLTYHFFFVSATDNKLCALGHISSGQLMLEHSNKVTMPTAVVFFSKQGTVVEEIACGWKP